MDVKSDIFGITKGRRLFEKIIWIVAAVVCILGVLFLMDRYVRDRTETVDIIVVGSEAINEDTLIGRGQLEKYAMIRKEYDPETMFLWEDIDSVLNTYSTYFIKEGTPIYKDSIYGQKRYRNEWMYDIDEDEEVLTIPFDYRVAGGNILMPGDKVRIRVYYEGGTDLFEGLVDIGADNDAYMMIDPMVSDEEILVDEGILLDEEYYDYFDQSEPSSMINDKGDAVQVATIFPEIEVIDMLANGESIYEIYLELRDMSEEERLLKLSDSNFLKTIIPDALIVIVNEEEAMAYLQAISVDAEFIITILPREMNETVLDKVQLIDEITYGINHANGPNSIGGM